MVLIAVAVLECTVVAVPKGVIETVVIILVVAVLALTVVLQVVVFVIVTGVLIGVGIVVVYSNEVILYYFNVVVWCPLVAGSPQLVFSVFIFTIRSTIHIFLK